MYQPLSLFLGLRYIASRRVQGFSRFISASSTAGIALGVAVLIVVLSAMNGFEKALAEKLLSIIPHSELVAVNQPISNWQQKIAQLKQQPGIKAAAPVITKSGMMQYQKQLKAVEVRGIDVELEQSVSDIHNYLIAGSWLALNQDPRLTHANAKAVIGAGIANKLSVNVGDKVQILLPKQVNKVEQVNNLSQKFSAPKRLSVEIAGIFKFGGVVDDSLVYLPIEFVAQNLDYAPGQVQGIRLAVDDVFQAPKIAKQAAYGLDHYVYIHDWTRTQGHLFNDIQLVRMVMFIVMVLVIAVASFNIVSTLIMVVNDKKSDIAILKTMGAKPRLIMTTFILQGMANGLLGCLFGGLFGVLFALNLTEIIRAIESAFNTQFLSGDVYFIDYLPTDLHTGDVVITLAVALLMSILATIYPAWRATKVEPAQVLGQV